MLWSIVWFLMGLWIGYGIKRKLAYHIIKVVEICQRTRLEYYEILGESIKLKEEIKKLKEKLNPDQ